MSKEGRKTYLETTKDRGNKRLDSRLARGVIQHDVTLLDARLRRQQHTKKATTLPLKSMYCQGLPLNICCYVLGSIYSAT